jgi:endonuclease/exonuclease/phosphatase family metal-dependent hydrolase
MRVMTYNILEGFRKDGALDQERIDACLRVIDRIRPDVLVLNEALYCESHAGIHTDYAELLGFSHSATMLYAEAWGNVILSQYPIARQGTLQIYNRGALAAEIRTPDGLFTVATYHPHPSRFPENKAIDFGRLADVGQEIPFVVLGDFNAVSPADQPDVVRLQRGFATLMGDADKGLHSLLRFIEGGQHVFEALSEQGFHDLVPPAGRKMTLPTDMLNLVKDTAMRIDHIWGSSSIASIDGEVVHDADTEIASDHHPVWADIAIFQPVLTPVSTRHKRYAHSL